MSYILDALTRSQKQRERLAIPTLTTAYLTDGSKHSTSSFRQGIAIALASTAVLVALYTMSNRPFRPDALGRGPATAAAMPSVSPPSSTRAAAVRERATNLSRAEADTAGVAVAHSRPRNDAVEHDRPQAAAIRAPEAAGHGKPIPGQSATDATSEITTARAHSPGKLPEQRPSPESRRLVDEILALRRETGRDAPRGQAPSDALQDMQAPAAPVRGEDVSRRPERGGNPPAVGAGTGSANELPTLRELPPETQAAIPPLDINVHAYAQTSKERMVIINMNSYHEGDRIREGPVIDAITPTGVVLIFNGQRFQLTAR